MANKSTQKMGLKEKNNKNKNEEDARSEFGGERLLVWFELIGEKKAGRWVDVHCSAPAPKLASFIGT